MVSVLKIVLLCNDILPPLKIEYFLVSKSDGSTISITTTITISKIIPNLYTFLFWSYFFLLRHNVYFLDCMHGKPYKLGLKTD